MASLGLEAQGNEFSYYMLLASSFVLNQSARAGQWTVFPWLHTNCNQRCIGDQLRGVSGVSLSLGAAAAHRHRPYTLTLHTSGA